jgi:hypothetical protein
MSNKAPYKNTTMQPTNMQLIFALGKPKNQGSTFLKRKKIETWVSYVLRQVKHCCVAKRKK